MLREVVMRICDEVGGSAVQHSNGNVHVLHCPFWTCRATAILQRECPNATISVESSVSSLSGFVVVAHQKKNLRGATRRRLFIAGLSTFMLFTLIWTLFGMKINFDPPLLLLQNWSFFPHNNNNKQDSSSSFCSTTTTTIVEPMQKKGFFESLSA